MPTTAEKPTEQAEESVKDWAKRIAAEAPPLSDDQFHQLHALFVSSAAHGPRRVRTPERRAA